MASPEQRKWGKERREGEKEGERKNALTDGGTLEREGEKATVLGPFLVMF